MAELEGDGIARQIRETSIRPPVVRGDQSWSFPGRSDYVGLIIMESKRIFREWNARGALHVKKCVPTHDEVLNRQNV